MTRCFICALTLLGLLPLLTVRAAPPSMEDTKLAKFFRSYLDEDFKRHPLKASFLGDHRYDDRLDDVSAKARQGDFQFLKDTRQKLEKSVDYNKLSNSAKVDYGIFHHHLIKEIWLAENFDPYVTDPRVYNLYVSDSIYLPLTQSTLSKEAVIKNCITRMKQIPAVLKEAKKNLKNPPPILVERAIGQNQGAMRFYKSGLFQVVGKTEQLDDLKAAAKKLLPVLEDYQIFLEDTLKPNAKGDWRIGKEKFAKKLELELDAGLTLEDVQREATNEFDRVVNDMYVISRQLWSQAYPNKPLPPDDVQGRRSTIQKVLDHFNKEHGKPEDLVKNARAGVDEIKKFIADKDILRLPDPDRCQIIEMPEFQRGFSVAYLNPAPPLDQRARSVYAISPPPSSWSANRVTSFMEEYNRHMLQILTIHEAYPGHYVQLAYANRHPSLIRRVLYSGVYAEGWAVYTEQMMLDEGYGKGNLPLRLNQLKFYLRAVANALLDYRMHCTDYSDKEALRWLTEEVFQSEGEAVGKIIRSKQSSCQLSTYFVGRTAFYRLRVKAQRKMGEKFSLGRYHEAVLNEGTIPVKYLPDIILKGGK